MISRSSSRPASAKRRRTAASFVGHGGARGGVARLAPGTARRASGRSSREAVRAPASLEVAHELVAGDGDQDAGPRVDRDADRRRRARRAPARWGRGGGRARPAAIRRGCSRRAGGCARPAAARFRPSTRPLSRTDVLDRHDGFGAGRQRRSRHDADGFAGAERRRRQVARGDEARRAPRADAPGDGLRDADRVAVHRRGVERRPVHVGGDVLGEHAAERLRERRLLGAAGRARPDRTSASASETVITRPFYGWTAVRISACPSTNTSADRARRRRKSSRG